MVGMNTCCYIWSLFEVFVILFILLLDLWVLTAHIARLSPLRAVVSLDSCFNYFFLIELSEQFCHLCIPHYN